MDLLTNIELEMKNAMLDIQTSATSQGYTYYNDVTTVNLEDECIAVERGNYPTVSIYMEPEERQLGGYQRVYSNEAYFRLVCSVTLDTETDTPRFAINTKMNELLADIKKTISANYNLNCSCDLVELLNSRRVYNTNADEFRAGDLIVHLKVKYVQSRNNPDLKCNL